VKPENILPATGAVLVTSDANAVAEAGGEQLNTSGLAVRPRHMSPE
jgi:hypothetical protein